MLYWILKILIKLTLPVFFRRIYFIDAHLIPRNKPVILACNHANSFLDDFILGTLLRRQLHFLARSDVFRTKFLRFVLGQFYMLPIYRILEGSENLHKNQETFKKTTKILKKRGMIMIHSEGICIIEKRLRPLKKGTARIAFTAEESTDFDLNLNIVPVIFNYTDATKFRKEILIKIGEPFKTVEFKEQYNENPARAINAFNQKLKTLLQPIIITIKDDETIQTTENLFTIFRNNFSYPLLQWKFTSPDRLNMELKVSENINKFYEESRTKYDEISLKVNNYFKELNKYKISDKSVAKPEKYKFFKTIFIILGFPISILGYFGNYLILKLVKMLIKKTVKSDVFISSVKIGAGIIFYFIYISILLIAGLLILKIYSLLILVVLPTSFFIYLFHKEIHSNLLSSYRLIKALKNNPDKLEELKSLRAEIISMVDQPQS